MNQETVTLIAASIAALASIGNVGISYFTSLLLEKEKIEIQHVSERKSRLANSLDNFSKQIASAVQISTFMLWNAKYDPSKFSNEIIENYDKEISEILPNLLTTRVSIAAHNVDVYNRITELTKDFYALDAQIALAARDFRSSDDKNLEKFVTLYERSNELHAGLGPSIAGIMSSNAVSFQEDR